VWQKQHWKLRKAVCKALTAARFAAKREGGAGAAAAWAAAAAAGTWVFDSGRTQQQQQQQHFTSLYFSRHWVALLLL
jgi:polyisoprenoid-binding protein YceI